jgi:hypothetical protein
VKSTILEKGLDHSRFLSPKDSNPPLSLSQDKLLGVNKSGGDKNFDLSKLLSPKENTNPILSNSIEKARAEFNNVLDELGGSKSGLDDIENKINSSLVKPTVTEEIKIAEAESLTESKLLNQGQANQEAGVPKFGTLSFQD